MDVKELMVGDWYYDQDLNKPRKWHQLQFAEEYGNSTYMLLVKPIPLTEELFKMNGWKEDKTYCTLRLDKFSYLEFYWYERRLRKYWQDIDEWDNITFQCNCNYVHELQHALRLCGLTDMADNFKVN